MKKIFSLLCFFITFLSPTQASGQLEKIFTLDVLNTDIQYLESMTGVAKSTNNQSLTKDYVVNGCYMRASFSRDWTVRSLALAVSPTCTFDMGNLMGSMESIQANTLTFGTLGPVSYYADCLQGCGNSYDPSVYEHAQSSRADNFIEVLLATQKGYLQDGPWVEAMNLREGEDWVDELKFNCSDKYHDIAQSSLYGLPAEIVVVGYNLQPFNCNR